VRAWASALIGMAATVTDIGMITRTRVNAVWSVSALWRQVAVWSSNRVECAT